MSLPDSHRFVDLSDGRCHFRIDGPENGPPLLLVHGATVPGFEFERTLPMLNAAGYRTLCPDLYGHGYSARPAARYDYALFLRQLKELLDREFAGRRVSLIGHSLGAVIAARLLVGNPERFDALVMAAPMLDFRGKRRVVRLLDAPGLGELIVHAWVVPMLVRRRTRRYRPIEDGRFVRKFRDQLRVPGYGRALLSLMRSGALGDQADVYRDLARTANRVLLIRGANDDIVPAGQFDTLAALHPGARALTVADTAHAMLLTHPDAVLPAVLDFLSDRSSGRRAQECHRGLPGPMRG